jgi:hypothetical protein
MCQLVIQITPILEPLAYARAPSEVDAVGCQTWER